ncbi:hypothetical protein GcM1_232008 [Golovinomyces cichoracearum]|uniref:Uncharacterized protein n=1 Tax=Golovinomyces cichoracearum TaxID=62708 RepID=A0A420IM53_9PEZI|nr:hypothetical protein GcM1_232008 [Golovinomyces cichoracearum]
MFVQLMSSATMFSLAVATMSSSAYQQPTVLVTKNITIATAYTTKYATVTSCSASAASCPTGQAFSSIPLIIKPEMNKTTGHRVPMGSLISNTTFPSTTLRDASMTRFPLAPHTIVPVSSSNSLHVNASTMPRVFSSAIVTHKSQTIESAFSQTNRTASTTKYSTIDSCDSSSGGCPTNRVASTAVTESPEKPTYSTESLVPATNTAAAPQGTALATRTVSAKKPENSDTNKNDHVTAAGRKIQRSTTLMVAGAILAALF